MGFHLVDPNYQAAIDLMTTRPAAAIMERQNRFVRKCRDMGILAALDTLYLFVADSQASRINFANPGVNTCTLSATPPTFAATGATGNGSNAVLSTGFVPSTSGGHWTLNDACMFIWSNTTGASAGASNYDMGGATNANLRCRNSSNVTAGALNDGTVLSVANTDATGLFVIRRTAASGTDAKTIRRNLAQVATATTASTSLGGGAISILGIPGVGAGAREGMFAGFGAALSNDQCNALYWIGREYGFACGALS